MPSNYDSIRAQQKLRQWSSRLSKNWKNGTCEPSTHYLLPLLSVDGTPASLKNHFFFKPLFKFPRHSFRPNRIIWKCGRQLGKTYQIMESDVLNCKFMPSWRSLTVTPLYEQIKKISTEVTHNLTNQSPFKNIFTDSSSKKGVLTRSYKQGGVQYFSYAYLDSTRIRSISGIDLCNIDEVQHMLKEHVPVILETMSAKPETAFVNYTGTPLSLSNPIESLWQASSMCEWVTKCPRCNKFNIPNIEHDLLHMIGKTTVVCAKCGKPLDMRKGTWVSPKITNPIELEEQLHGGFAGFHVSQVIHPLHYAYPAQWKKLRRKMESPEYSTAQFFNEVCGESYDSSDRLLSRRHINQVCTGRPNTIEEALIAVKECQGIGIGIDWTGGGDSSTSFTKIVIGGRLQGSLDIKIAYVETFPKTWDVDTQLQRIIDLIDIFKPTTVAHDYNGMGSSNEALLLSAGLDPRLIWSQAYVTQPRAPIMSLSTATEGHRDCWNLDRVRSLITLFGIMKSQRIQFPEYASMNFQNGESTSNRMDDFMAMFGEEYNTPRGISVYRIQTDPNNSDDLVHATNYLCWALWMQAGEFPRIADRFNISQSVDDLASVFPQPEETFIINPNNNNIQYE